MWEARSYSSFGNNSMSRLGKQPVQIPEKVEISFEGGVLKVKGPKGELTRTVPKIISVTVADGTVTLAKTEDTKEARALWGTIAAHLRNMIEGVTNGFKKVLEIEGVGYRLEAQNGKVKVSAGYSHPVELVAPQGVEVASEKNVMTITGIDKEVVGQFAADVRAVRKPEPYKGKGIRYQGEYIIRKQGKKGVA